MTIGADFLSPVLLIVLVIGLLLIARRQYLPLRLLVVALLFLDVVRVSTWTLNTANEISCIHAHILDVLAWTLKGSGAVCFAWASWSFLADPSKKLGWWGLQEWIISLVWVIGSVLLMFGWLCITPFYSTSNTQVPPQGNQSVATNCVVKSEKDTLPFTITTAVLAFVQALVIILISIPAYRHASKNTAKCTEGSLARRYLYFIPTLPLMVAFELVLYGMTLTWITVLTLSDKSAISVRDNVLVLVDHFSPWMFLITTFFAWSMAPTRRELELEFYGKQRDIFVLDQEFAHNHSRSIDATSTLRSGSKPDIWRTMPDIAEEDFLGSEDDVDSTYRVPSVVPMGDDRLRMMQREQHGHMEDLADSSSMGSGDRPHPFGPLYELEKDHHQHLSDLYYHHQYSADEMRRSNVSSKHATNEDDVFLPEIKGSSYKRPSHDSGGRAETSDEMENYSLGNSSRPASHSRTTEGGGNLPTRPAEDGFENIVV